jgi:hypothetical protein
MEKDEGRRNKDLGHKTDVRRRTLGEGPSTKNLGPTTNDLG